jgi:hypothetical protein
MSYISSRSGISILGGPPLKTRTNSVTSFSNTLSTSFDGANDYVTIGQPANLEWDPNANEICISLWFKPSDVANQRFILAKARMSDANISYVMAVNSDASVYAIVGGNSNGSGTLVQNTWNHLLLTIRNVAGTYRFFLFLNGSQVGTGIAGTGQNTDMDWLIGAARWDTNASDSYPFLGKVDEVTFWNTAFSDAEVTALYNSGVPANPNSHSKASSLLHWYRMGDSDTYPIITDRKGSANGTCTNMAGASNFQSDVPQ